MKHCILVKYNETVDAAAKEQLRKEIQKLFGGLTEINGISGTEVIPNVVDRPNRYDLLIRIEMDQKVLPVYDDSEIHKRWKSEYGKYLEKKAIFDYE